MLLRRVVFAVSVVLPRRGGRGGAGSRRPGGGPGGRGCRGGFGFELLDDLGSRQRTGAVPRLPSRLSDMSKRPTGVVRGGVITAAAAAAADGIDVAESPSRSSSGSGSRSSSSIREPRPARLYPPAAQFHERRKTSRPARQRRRPRRSRRRHPRHRRRRVRGHRSRRGRGEGRGGERESREPRLLLLMRSLLHAG